MTSVAFSFRATWMVRLSRLNSSMSFLNRLQGKDWRLELLAMAFAQGPPPFSSMIRRRQLPSSIGFVLQNRLFDYKTNGAASLLLLILGAYMRNCVSPVTAARENLGSFCQNSDFPS